MNYIEWNGFKLYQTVYILDCYNIVKTNILEIYDDYYSDEDNFKCKWVRTDRGHERLEDVYETEREAEYRVQNKKDAYDRYVTSIY
jgi:hypothetical protein